QKLPAQLKQPVARRLEAELEDIAALGVPKVGKDVRLDAVDRQLVAKFDKSAQSIDELGGRTGRDESAAHPLDARGRTGDEMLPWHAGQLWVAGESLVVAPENRSEATTAQHPDLDRRGDPAEGVARPD